MAVLAGGTWVLAKQDLCAATIYSRYAMLFETDHDRQEMSERGNDEMSRKESGYKSAPQKVRGDPPPAHMTSMKIAGLSVGSIRGYRLG